MTEKVDSYHRHEAGDRLAMLTGSFEDYIVTHSFITRHPELKERADHIIDQMASLYQLVWNFPVDEEQTQPEKE